MASQVSAPLFLEKFLRMASEYCSKINQKQFVQERENLSLLYKDFVFDTWHFLIGFRTRALSGVRTQKFLLFLTFIIFLSLMKDSSLRFCNADPTDGFVLLPLTNSNFVLQKPYDIPLAERYSYANGVHRLRVYSTDQPYKAGSPTGPRTEIRIQGYDYSSGIWQFEGYVFVPSRTSGTSIMQVHRSDGKKPATDLMLMIFNGELRFYSGEIVESDFYDRWVRVNVIHDADANKLTTFINGVQKLEVDGNGPSDFYFKCGVYAQHDDSYYMESRWRDIKVYKMDG